MFLLETPLWVTCVPTGLILFSAWLAARLSRDTNDFRKSCKIYFPSAAVAALVFVFLGLPAIIGAAAVLAGFVALSLFANHFFYS